MCRSKRFTDEIKHVRQLLREEADRAMERLCGPLGFTYKSEEAGQRAGGFTAIRAMTATSVALRTSSAVSAGASVATAVAAAPEILLLNDEQSAPLRRFYCGELRPYLQNARRSFGLSDAGRARSSFAAIRTLVPHRRTRRSAIWKRFAMRRGSSRCKSACTAGCMAGCWHTFRFRWR